MQGDVERNLRELQERNRLRREEEKRRVTEEEKRKRELERGFVTHFSGANRQERGGGHATSRTSGTTSTTATAAARRRRRSLHAPTGPSSSSASSSNSLSRNADRSPLSSLNRSTGNIAPASKGSRAESQRRSAVFGGAGSQIAAQRGRRQWGRVVEPEFLRPANLPAISRTGRPSKGAREPGPNDENVRSLNARPSLQFRPSKPAVDPGATAAQKLGGRRGKTSDALSQILNVDDLGAHTDGEEVYPDDFETVVEDENCRNYDQGQDDSDAQSLPEILEILESPKSSRKDEDAYESSLLSRSMSLSMSMSMSMGLHLSRLSSWRHGRRDTDEHGHSDRDSAAMGRSPDIDDLEAGRRARMSPEKGQDIVRKQAEVKSERRAERKQQRSGTSRKSAAATATAKAPTTRKPKALHLSICEERRDASPVATDLNASYSLLSPLEDSFVVQEEDTGRSERSGAPSRSTSFLREKPITVRSSPIYNRSLGASSVSLSGLLESSLSISDERWEEAVKSSRTRGVSRASSAAGDLRALSKSMCLERGPKTQSAGVLDLRSRRPSRVAPRGRRLRLNFVETWGDIYYMGLTGLALLVRNEKGKLVERYPLRKRIKARPSDINVSGHSGDPRTLDKVIDGWNNTSSEHHMWLIEFNPNEDHIMEIDLGSRHFALAGIRVWNYNKNIEDTRRGVRTAHVTLDGVSLSPPQGLTFRRSPGTDEVDFGQTILFEMEADESLPQHSVVSIEEKERELCAVEKRVLAPVSTARATGTLDKAGVWQGGDGFRDVPRPPAGVPTGNKGAAVLHGALQQDWEVPLLPCGFVLRFDFLASQGDPQWVGLDKLELFDAAGEPMDLDTLGGRMLVPGKGELNTSWAKPWMTHLAPPDAARPARLYVIFDRPITLGAISIANLSAHPARGAGEVAVFLDSLIIFHGQLRSAEAVRSQSVVFTPQSSVMDRAEQSGEICYCGEKEQTVVFIDNNRSMS